MGVRVRCLPPPREDHADLSTFHMISIGTTAMAERCENYHAIDLTWLGRQKMLRPGCASSIRWSHAGGGAAVSVGIESSHGCVRLCYRSRAGDTWEQVREVVPFRYTQTRFGGRRRWFACPACGKACRVLFGVPFRCRRCHGLHYSSQYQTAGGRAATRLQALRARLGGSADLREPFPTRPKHMHCKTYARLRALHLKLARRFASGFASELERLERSIRSR
jgi:hypothetical protein